MKAPDEGWGAGRTVGGLAASAVLMAAFAVNEQRRAHPLVPMSIFRIKGLAAADATQVSVMRLTLWPAPLAGRRAAAPGSGMPSTPPGSASSRPDAEYLIFVGVAAA